MIITISSMIITISSMIITISSMIITISSIGAFAGNAPLEASSNPVTHTDQSTLSKLLQSKSKSAQLLGLGVALVLFVPSVCRVADNPDLTIWQRIEQLSVATAQTLLSVALAAIPPEMFDSKPQSEAESETETEP